MRLSLYSPGRRLFVDRPVSEVTLTSSEGMIQILPGHAPMMGSLETGSFSFSSADNAQQGSQAGKSEGFISTGFYEVRDDAITLTADTVELQGEIDVERAKRAQHKAEEALKDPTIDEKDFKKYQLKLQRALIRQQVSSRH